MKEKEFYVEIKDRTGCFFIIDNRIMDIWFRIIGPGAFSFYCLLKRMCNGNNHTAFPIISQEDWACYLGMSSESVRKHIKILEKHKLIEVIEPSNKEKIQGKPFQYILNSLEDLFPEEEDFPKEFPNNCRFNDPIYNRNSTLFKVKPKNLGNGPQKIWGTDPKKSPHLYKTDNYNTKTSLTEKEKEKKKRKRIKTSSRINYSYIISGWNNLSDQCSISPIIKIGAARQEKIRTRIQDFDLSEKDWYCIFEKIKSSDFLNGKNDRGWVITFDWLIKNETNLSKVMEGNYDNKKPNGKTRIGGAQVIPGKYDDVGMVITADGKQITMKEYNRTRRDYA